MIKTTELRFVPIKTEGQQAILTLHRSRSLLAGERVALVNQVPGFLTEYGIVLPQGRRQVRSQLPSTLEDAENASPYLAREVFIGQYRRLFELGQIIDEYDYKIETLAKSQND